MEYAIGIKNVSYNEAIFQGHFPNNAIFPGALLLEALAQMTGIMYAYSEEDSAAKNSIGYLAGIKSMRFYKVVKPGDQIILKSEYKNGFGNIIEAKITAYVEDKLVAKGIILVTQCDEE